MTRQPSLPLVNLQPSDGDGATTYTEESGAYDTTTFEIESTVTVASTLEKTGNVITGEYASDSTLDTDTELYAAGDDTVNSYEHWKTSYVYLAWHNEGNAINGSYSLSEGTSESGSTASEENTYAAGSATFTEILYDSFNYTETGNSVTGAFLRDVTGGVRTSSLEAETYDGTDVYTVTQSTAGTFTRSESGNRIEGGYYKNESASDEYEVEQTGVGTKNFTLTITGTNVYTDVDEGNTVTGIYTRTKTGTDTYYMEINGTKVGGAYSQTITGQDNYTLTDDGNLATGHYERTITGSGEYDRTTTGAGATLPTDADDYNYSWDQTGDPHSGVFDLTPNGTTRYDLLEDFFDISNTNAAQSQGHMNVYPFGQTFVDPFWDDLKMIGGFVVGSPFQATAAAARGGVDSGAMLLNAGTLGLTPLNGHVNNLIQENGTSYAVANNLIVGGVVVATSVGGGAYLHGVRAARTARAAAAAEAAAATPAGHIATLRAMGLSNSAIMQEARAGCEAARAAGQPTRFWTEMMRLLGN